MFPATTSSAASSRRTSPSAPFTPASAADTYVCRIWKRRASRLRFDLTSSVIQWVAANRRAGIRNGLCLSKRQELLARGGELTMIFGALFEESSDGVCFIHGGIDAFIGSALVGADVDELFRFLVG